MAHKEKPVTLRALRNIPIGMCVGSPSEIPMHLQKHPGGVRVEKGTEITVAPAQAELLRSLKYAA